MLMNVDMNAQNENKILKIFCPVACVPQRQTKCSCKCYHHQIQDLQVICLKNTAFRMQYNIVNTAVDLRVP
jgi:hypothetical protein